MSEKIFGEIQNTEELNELAVNLRKNKEFDEIRLLCSENHISEEDAEEFIQGKRLHLADPGHQEKSNPLQSPVWDAVRASMKDGPESDIGKTIESIERGAFDHAVKEESEEEVVQMGTASLADIIAGIPKPTEEELNAAAEPPKAAPVYTVEDARKKLESELKIYRDGDSKYVVEKLIEKCETDKELLNAIMLPHKSYDNAFRYFYQKSRTVGYKMPHGNMVYLDNDSAVKLSIEYFKRDDAAEAKKNPPKKSTAKPKDKGKEVQKKQASPPKSKIPPKAPEKPKQEPKPKKNEMAGQMSLFDF